MSKADIVNKFKKPKLTAADKLYGNEEDNVVNETAATNEESEKNVEVSDSIANAYNIPQKREKVLKGIYLDEDVLEVYKDVSEKMPRGWGSQLVSDLLRKEFIKQGAKLDPK